MSSHDKGHNLHDWNRQSIEISNKVANSKYQRRHELEYDTKNMPNLSDTDIYSNYTIHNFYDDRTIPATYTESRKKPLLINGSDFKMSVVRFDCPSQEIPMFYWPGNDVFWVQMLCEDDTGNVLNGPRVYVTYNPREDPEPADSNKAIWTTDQMLQAINAAIETACVNLPDSPTGPTANPMAVDYEAFGPKLVFNQESGLFSVLYPPISTTEFGPGNAAPWATLAWTVDSKVQLSFSQTLDFLFESFPKIEFKTGSAVEGVVYKVYNTYNNFKAVPQPAVVASYPSYATFYEMKQEHPSLNLWFELYKIVIITNMEVRKEYIGVSSDNASTGGPDSLNARGILSDFDVAFQRPTSLRINYTPLAEFKWIDILKEGPLDFIDFGIYYQTQNGQLRPLMLEPGQACNIKLLFRKK